MENPTGKKRARLWIGGFVAACAIAVLALVLLVDIQGYKPRIESAASETLGPSAFRLPTSASFGGEKRSSAWSGCASA